MTLLLAALAALWLQAAPQTPSADEVVTPTGPEAFDMRIASTGLTNPWQMRWGPEGFIWVTERTAGRITRVDPATGARRVAVDIPEAIQRHTQDGVLGLALSPTLSTPAGPHTVYVAFTYDADPGPAEVRRLKVRRYTYSAATAILSQPVDIIEGLPAGNDHISGRLAFGTDGKLYLTLGDQGLGQLAAYCEPIHAQDLPTAAEIQQRDWHSYVGKILRINLDGSIPTDNPLIAGVRSHVFSYGHRNAQGLAVAPNGRIYASEHGPSMDDELNVIRAGGNYGWPYVAGYQDDRVYVYADWSRSAPQPCASLPWDAIVAPSSVPQQKESAWSSPDFVPPIRTFFTVSAAYSFSAQGNAVIAPSGIAVYSSPTGIPGWTDSVLVTSLTRGAVYRVKLDASGAAATGPSLEYFKTLSRYRDVLVSPDGRTIYLATDSTSKEHPGAIVAFTFRAPR